VAKHSLVFIGIFMFSRLKNISLALGFYTSARKVNLLLRPGIRRSWKEDIVFYRNLLPPGALCFDVGAHFGAKSETLLRAGASVVAFEPNPNVVEELRTRCGRNRNWAFVAAALGSKATIMTMYEHQRSGESSFDPEWKGGDGIVGAIHVPVMTLDTAIASFGIPHYCKIDVEGWEDEVLRGLSSPIPLISFEFHINERITPRTKNCLRRLMEFGPASVNVTPAETVAFHFEEWMPLDEFLEWYPGDLERTLPLYPVGDIYVRLDEQTM